MEKKKKIEKKKENTIVPLEFVKVVLTGDIFCTSWFCCEILLAFVLTLMMVLVWVWVWVWVVVFPFAWFIEDWLNVDSDLLNQFFQPFPDEFVLFITRSL